MRLPSLIAVFAIAFCCHAQAGDDLAKKLQGAWEVTDLVAYGKKVDPKLIQGTKFIFAKDRLTIVPAKKDLAEFDTRSFTFKINPGAKPAEIDLTALDGENKGITSPGIFELQGDTLRWCQPDGPKTKDRPKGFASPEKSDLYLFTLKRSK